MSIWRIKPVIISTFVWLIVCQFMIAESSDKNTLCIESFEAQKGIDNLIFLCPKGERVKQNASDGQYSLKVTYPRLADSGKIWPSFSLPFSKYGKTDWSNYDQLLVDFYNPHDLSLPLKLKVTDANHKSLQLWLGDIAPKQMTTIRVPFDNFSKVVDVSNLLQLNFYMTSPPRNYTFFVDNIRFVQEDLTVVDAKIRDNMDSLGYATAIIKLNRSGKSTIKVIDARGKEIAQSMHEGRWITWRWNGMIGSKPVVPGKYRLVLNAKEQDPNKVELSKSLGTITIARPLEDSPEAVLWYEKSTKKVMLHDTPCATKQPTKWDSAINNSGSLKPLTIDMARNEYEAGQLVFLSRSKPFKLIATLEKLKHEVTGKMFPVNNIEILQVGYLKTKEPGVYPVNFAGWWPDPLLPNKKMIAVPGECMPIWVSLKTNKDTVPGIYRGSIALNTDEGETAFIPLRVNVYNSVLPDDNTIKTAFAFHVAYPHGLRRIYGKAVPAAVRKKYWEFITDRRLNFGSIYRQAPPSIEELNHYRAKGRLDSFNLLQIGSKTNEKITNMLDLRVADLRRDGLVDRAYFYGFDEFYKSFDVVKKMFSFYKDRYPGVKTMTTLRDSSYGLKTGLSEVVDIWVPMINHYDKEMADKARERGKEVWWYTCMYPCSPFPNFFVETPALTPRLLWWMLYQHNIPGLLYFQMAHWPFNSEPITLDGSNRTSWDPCSLIKYNGDGSLLCAGPDGPITTIRLENIRDGIEDHAMLTMYDQKNAGTGSSKNEFCDRLVKSMTDYCSDPDEFANVRKTLLTKLSQ